MVRQLHSASAAAAMTLVVCVASVAFMIFVLLPGVSVTAAHGFAIPPVSTHILHIARSAAAVLILGYGTGVAGWAAIFALRRDGMHRLASVLNAR